MWGLEFAGVLAAVALWMALVAAMMFSVASGLVLDLRARELLVPLWVYLSRDRATEDRLDAIIAARREEEPYEPRHALSAEEQRLADRAQRDALTWLASYRWPPM